MKINTLDSADIKDKVVVVTCNLDVGLKEGKITDDTRIVQSIPTLKYILEQEPKRLHILAKMGRPKGKIVPELSQKILIPGLEKLLAEKVEFMEDFSVGNSQIQLHENVRFWPGEKKNDPEFVKELQKLGGEVFVMDAFATAHRKQASVVGLAEFIPTYAGKLIEKEIKHLSPYISKDKITGLTILVGGAKMETKVAVLKHFAKTASNICIGGALANTFLAAEGYDVGESLYEEEELETAREVLMTAEKYGTGFHIPIDVICAEAPDAPAMDFPIRDVMGTLKIFDLGPHTVASYEEILAHSETVIWNGPTGFYEKEAFANSTQKLADFLAEKTKAKTILGGGDTLDALKKFNVPQGKFTHVSTGGGAMLEFLEGKELPGIKILSA